MHPLLQNKYVRYVGIGITGLVALFIILIVSSGLIDLLSSSTGLSNQTFTDTSSIGVADYSGGKSASQAYDGVARDAEMVSPDYYQPPVPTAPQGYTSNLETYETTAYNASGRTKQFDALCNTLSNFKTDPAIHFKNLTSNLNNCQAAFFVEEAQVQAVLNTLQSFKDVELSRNTTSVTRHKQQLESQTNILRQQLTRVESSLNAAEAQLNRLNTLFNSSDEVTRLSSEVTKSLQYIDQLTRQKISLINQLDQLYQQSADLQERLEVVEFNVSVSRLNTIYPNQVEQKWLRAWNNLKEHFTDTLIGVTAIFGIFLMRAVQVILYILVGIVILRGLWKFVKLLWSKW